MAAQMPAHPKDPNNRNGPRLPESVDEITAGWLTSALIVRHPGTLVAEATQTWVIRGSGTKIALELVYESDPAGLPTSLIVKAALEEHGIPVSIRPEAFFYDIVCPQISVSTPRCVYSAHDEEPGVVVLENLLARGCQMTDSIAGWGVDAVRDALAQLASLHVRWWGQGHVPGVPDFAGSNALGAVLMEPGYWESCVAGPTAEYVPEPFRDREQMARWVPVLWALDNSEPRCLLHGDAHLGNTYIDADGRPGFLDWQSICAGHWGREVCYFVAGALSIEDRRTHEESLLRGYLDALAAGGADPVPGWDEAWLSYRRHMLHGLLWFLCPTQMQPLEIINANVERFGAAASDHQVDRLF
ncbi:MAG: phosphotransferase [Myxococcota bacterium]